MDDNTLQSSLGPLCIQSHIFIQFMVSDVFCYYASCVLRQYQFTDIKELHK